MINNSEAAYKQKNKWKENSNYDEWEKLDYLSGSNDELVKITTALMLENQRLHDAMVPHGTVDKSIELVSKIIPNLLAHKIVSVQPKFSPGSIVYYTEFAYKDNAVKISVANEDMISRTRKLKCLQDDVSAEKIIDEINNEILADLYNNCGTVTNVTNDSSDNLYAGIAMTSGDIFRKTLRERNYWLVVSPHTADRYSKTLESFHYGRYRVYVANNFRDDCILMGQKGDEFFDSEYIWCPYIMLAKTPEISDPDFVPKPGLMIRYGKKLTRNGGKSYARIMLPPEKSIDFSTIIVKAKVK